MSRNTKTKQKHILRLLKKIYIGTFILGQLYWDIILGMFHQNNDITS